MPITVIKSSKDDPVFKRLQQDYEEEFSVFTHYEKGPDGLYDQDQLISHWSKKGYDVYLAYSESGEPIGFSVINLSSMIGTPGAVLDVAEFYVVPLARLSGVGKKIACSLFDLYPNQSWEVRQIAGLEPVTKFWNSVISEYSRGIYSERYLSDSEWTGPVQFFISRSKDKEKSLDSANSCCF